MRERSSGEIASALGRKEHLVDANRSHAHDDTAAATLGNVPPSARTRCRLGYAGSPSTSTRTPVIDTLRGLLLGTPMGNSAILAVAWCVVLALVGYPVGTSGL